MPLSASRELRVTIERLPIAGEFRISRGSKTEAVVVVAEIDDGGVVGRGECVPYARYGETVEGVAEAIRELAPRIGTGGIDRFALRGALPPGAARNALDCALWDLEAKLTGVPVWQSAGLDAAPGPVTTCYTLSIDTPERMGVAAGGCGRPVLKLKLAGDGADLDRVRAVRQGAPGARLIVDANEGWTLEDLTRLAPLFADLGVEMIEQPLPASADDALLGFTSPVPLGADESAHGLDSLERIQGKYAVVNIKLDKTGGLTEALEMKEACAAAGLDVMVGCMVATSLAMAPAFLLAQGARFVDLDGPLLLARDRPDGLGYDGGTVHPPTPALWG